MNKQKVLTDFSPSKYSDAELNLQAMVVSGKMEGNGNFPTTYPSPTPPLIDLNTTQITYTTALINSVTGGKEQIIAKNIARKKLETILQQLAIYVNTASGGDLAKMASTGFKLGKLPSPVGPLPKPGNFSVDATGIGRLELSVDPIEGAGAYHWELQQVGSTQPPIVKSSMTSSIVVNGLESTKQYACRVVAVGADKTTENWSDTIISTVL